MLPDWAPNLHPLVVHFPIALLFLAVGFDLVTWLLRRPMALVRVTAVLYALGALSALVAFLTGRAAADSLDLPTAVIPAVTTHADWAERTVWFFGIFALIRLALAWWRRPLARAAWLQGLLLLLGAGGLWLLYETGEHGAELVYAHGLGVASVRTLQAERDALAQVLQRQQAAAQFERLTEGGWRWTPGPGAEPILTDTFKVLDGTLSAITWTPGSEGLRLTLSETPLLLVGPGTLSGTELRARLRLDSLAGSVRLVYHVQDPRNYDFLELYRDRVRQGRLEDGRVRIFDEAPLEASGWLDVRVVAHGTHLRGYVNGRLVTHGHGPAAQPGPAGVHLQGPGVLDLGLLGAQPITTMQM